MDCASREVGVWWSVECRFNWFLFLGNTTRPQGAGGTVHGPGTRTGTRYLDVQRE
jgi:hypothetical protein